MIIIKDEDNNVWGQIEERLVSNSGLPAAFWTANQIEEHFAKVILPAGIPPGDYTVSIELFDDSGKRAGLFSTDGRFLGTQATLGTLSFWPPSGRTVILPDQHQALTGPLVASSPLPNSIGQGERLSADVWWEHTAEGIDEMDFQLIIGETTLVHPINVSNYQVGETYRQKVSWKVPADFPAGDWPVSITLVSEQNQARDSLGSITIEARDRLFDLPEGVTPLDVAFGTLGHLQSAQVTQDSQLVIDLVWQAEESQQIDYAMFVHVRDSAGNILTQIDRPPSKATSLWIKDEVIIDQITLPVDLGGRQIAIGLYDPDSGVRLPVYSADGIQLPDGQYLIDLSSP